MKVVVVESPAKAKTIEKYLGGGYRVLASYGHVRDLPPKDGSVRPEDGFAMTWQPSARSEKPLGEIRKALRGADELILATDPDREGEAISWHVRDVLAERRALAGVPVRRVVFNQVTKSAVLDAIANPRELDQALIDAYFARRALDYLVGFTLSPVLWRKLPGSRSAGRVQSVALRLVSEREAEIEAFRPREYWTVDAALRAPGGGAFTARLTHLDGKRLDRFALSNEAEARAAAEAVEAARLRVAGIERKRVKRHPHPPFTTSTLQQEASRKLGMGATRTMRVAQRLYEGVEAGGEAAGLITYMRTDAVQMAPGAVAAIRDVIRDGYGAAFLPDAPRAYRTRAKNAQEAHEAIRPTDPALRPREAARHLDRDQARLYELIWSRAVASQMASAELDRTAVTVGAEDGSVALRAAGSVVAFEGFLKLYREDRDDPGGEGDEEGRLLPPLKEGDRPGREGVTPEQHFTQPPPRFTEASLVKRLEELGIGRPSTYAAILQVLQDREYVRLEKRRFVPEDRGRIVTAFLANFFERYVQYNFTADLEGELDEVAQGKRDWRAVLERFWEAFSATVDGTSGLRVSEVLDRLDKDLGPHFFPDGPDGASSRVCPRCGDGRLNLKLGRYGAFIGCSNYPECRFTRQFAAPGGTEGEDGAGAPEEPRLLGNDPATGLPVSLRKGPYGLYAQLGEAGPGKSGKPKRASLPKGLDPADLDLEAAVGLLGLPREVGPHPESGEPILAGIGRFGPYLKLGAAYTSIPAGGDPLEVLSIGLNRAVDLIASKKGGGSAARTLGESGGKPVTLRSGRYGPYVQLDKTRASLPRGEAPEDITLERALELIQAKAERGGANGKAGATARKSPARAAATAKTGAKAKTGTKAKPGAKTTAKPGAKTGAAAPGRAGRTPG